MTSRRSFLRSAASGLLAASAARTGATREPARKAQIAISLDLEMSAEYPRRGMTEWNFQKGNLDDETKKYSLAAAKVVKQLGGVIHFFCVGQVLEQPDVEWLKQLHKDGHPIGNHTYDHINVKATAPADLQFRFRRAPWLIEGRSVNDVIRENIRLTTVGLQERCGVTARGFRTPGGFPNGLDDRATVRQILRDLGFTWISSKYPSHATGKPKERPNDETLQSIVAAQQQAQPFVYPDGLIELPMSPISDVSAFRTNFWKLEWFLEATQRCVEQVIRDRGTYCFLGHPSCLLVEDPQFEIVKLIATLARAAGDQAELVDLDAIAKDVRSSAPPK